MKPTRGDNKSEIWTLPAAFRHAILLCGKDYTILPEQWQCANLEQCIRQNNAVCGRTVFVKGKKTPFLFSPALSLEAGKELHCSFEIKSSAAGRGRIFFRLKDGKFKDTQRIEFKVESGGLWQRQELVIAPQNEETVQFRIDPVYADGADIGLRNFTVSEIVPPEPRLGVLPSQAAYQKIPAIEAAEEAKTSVTFSAAGISLATTPPIYLNYPAANGKFTVNFRGINPKTAAHHLKLSLDARDALNRRLPVKDCVIAFPAGTSRQTAVFTVPAECASATLTLTSTDRSGELTVSDTRLEPDWQPGELWLPWRSTWIWAPEGSTRCTFRRKFTLDALPAEAFLQLDADDAVTGVRINGKELPLKENAGNCFAFDEYSIARLLRPGVNELEIDAVNHSGAAGMMAEMAFYPESRLIPPLIS